MCAGTLVPYFIIHDFFEMNSNWLNKLDKLIISSKLKNHEISNRKPVTYDQLGIFKKQQSK